MSHRIERPLPPLIVNIIQRNNCDISINLKRSKHWFNKQGRALYILTNIFTNIHEEEVNIIITEGH